MNNISKDFRAPSVPLILSDPFLSIWSMSDKLYDDTTRHWTDVRQGIFGLLVVDDIKVYRFMGKVYSDGFRSNEPFGIIEQKELCITPLRTYYTFGNEICELKLTFTSPLLLDDPYLVSRPVSYIDYEIKNLDGKNHTYKVIFGMNSEIAGDKRETFVQIRKDSESFIRVGAGNDGVLAYSGDRCTANWGWFCLFSDSGEAFASRTEVFGLKGIYERDSKLVKYKDEITEEKFMCNMQKLICIENQYDVKANEEAKGFVCVGYDDIESIKLLGETALAYYKKDGETFEQACEKALDDHESVIERCLKRDSEILAEAEKIGSKYAQIISLAYRQAIAAHKLTWHGGEAQLLSKECASNGCIATVDVTYPSIPLFLMYNPELVFALLNPVFAFEKTDAWQYDFAPHDVGQYPLANGQVYGKRPEPHETERLKWYEKYEGNPLNRGEFYHAMQMPVEECGNMIICVATACMALGDFSYAEKHFDVLEKWSNYLIEYGLDPENQLCTDDFAGHLAHNCNLSVKAIMGLACFGLICAKLEKDGSLYYGTAKKYAAEWKKKAFAQDHYKLVYDMDDSWSMKYNLVWDKIMGLEIFDDDIFKTEAAYYKTKIETYGLALDSRSVQTKSDWEFWTAAMCGDEELEDAIISSVWKMLCETKDRVPFTDWYDVDTSNQRNFQNRTVQGGLFINMLARTDKLKNK